MHTIISYVGDRHDHYSPYGVPLFRAPLLLNPGIFLRFLREIDHLMPPDELRPDLTEDHVRARNSFLDAVLPALRDALVDGRLAASGARAGGGLQSVPSEHWLSIKGLPHRGAGAEFADTAVKGFLEGNLTIRGIEYFDIRIRPARRLSFDHAATALAFHHEGQPCGATWEKLVWLLELNSTSDEALESQTFQTAAQPKSPTVVDLRQRQRSILAQFRAALFANLCAGHFRAQRWQLDDDADPSVTTLKWVQIPLEQIAEVARAVTPPSTSGEPSPLLMLRGLIMDSVDHERAALEAKLARMPPGPDAGRPPLIASNDLSRWRIIWPDPFEVFRVPATAAPSAPLDRADTAAAVAIESASVEDPFLGHGLSIAPAPTGKLEKGTGYLIRPTTVGRKIKWVDFFHVELIVFATDNKLKPEKADWCELRERMIKYNPGDPYDTLTKRRNESDGKSPKGVELPLERNIGAEIGKVYSIIRNVDDELLEKCRAAKRPVSPLNDDDLADSRTLVAAVLWFIAFDIGTPKDDSDHRRLFDATRALFILKRGFDPEPSSVKARTDGLLGRVRNYRHRVKAYKPDTPDSNGAGAGDIKAAKSNRPNIRH